MTMKNAAITISRYSGSESGIRITITDEDSRLQLMEIDLTPEAFGNAVTGLGHVKGVVNEFISEVGFSRLGLVSCNRTITMPRPDSHTKEVVKKAARDHCHHLFSRLPVGIFGDGTDSQQGVHGVHRYVIRWWVPPVYEDGVLVDEVGKAVDAIIQENQS